MVINSETDEDGGFNLYLVENHSLKLLYLQEQKKLLVRLLFPLYVCVVMFSVTISTENIHRSINLPSLKSFFLKIGQISYTYYERDPFLLGPLSDSAIGKMVLLLPLGFLAPIIWGKISRLKNILLIGLMVSVGTQVVNFIGLKYDKLKLSTNMKEVVYSVLGVFIGRIIYKIISKKIGKFVFHR